MSASLIVLEEFKGYVWVAYRDAGEGDGDQQWNAYIFPSGTRDNGPYSIEKLEEMAKFHHEQEEAMHKSRIERLEAFKDKIAERKKKEAESYVPEFHP